jgi:flagellin-like protein
MKKTWNMRKKNEAVSPVIATILMVAITVVLAAVLYVMVIGMTPPLIDDLPLGLSQSGKNSTSVTILVSTAPGNALVTGTVIALSHDGMPTQISKATVYDAGATIAAWFTQASGWNYGSGFSEDNLKYGPGTKIIVTAGSISSGDEIVLSSPSGYFGLTTFNVS